MEEGAAKPRLLARTNRQAPLSHDAHLVRNAVLLVCATATAAACRSSGGSGRVERRSLGLDESATVTGNAPRGGALRARCTQRWQQ